MNQKKSTPPKELKIEGNIKCAYNAKRGGFDFCELLLRSMDERNAGLGTRMLMNFEARKITVIPVLRSGEFLKVGIALNYCPWCGTDLRRLYSPNKKRRGKP